MHTILHAAALASALAFAAPAAHAAAPTAEDALLESRVQQAQSQTRLADSEGSDDWIAAATRLAQDPPRATPRCADATTQIMGGKYAVTKDASGALCRIYDLSFPTLQTLTAHKTVSHLPVQAFTAHDFLAWIDGNYDEVLSKIQGFSATVKAGDTSQLAGWTKNLAFKPGRIQALGARNEIGLPKSFTAADLDLGDQFRFSNEEQSALRGALQSGGANILSTSDTQEWNKAISQPEALLAHIQFNWNDLNKVYDILLDGQFLPIRGPIALVDFSAQYKAGVERILRSIMHSAISKVVQFVPGPAQKIVALAVNESFGFVDQAYDYQLNQLEATLRAAASSDQAGILDTHGADRGLNLLFGASGDIVTQYITAVAQGKQFDWNNFEQIGSKSRYAAEKIRKTTLINMNSKMVLDGGCQMSIVDTYFGICAKDGKQTLHSMISTNTVLFWNLGAPTVYEYGSPNAVLLKRSASYVLSLGASMINLPVANFVMPYLATALKNYATAGIMDEAYHRNNLYQASRAGTLSSDDQSMLNVMYLQNLNLLLPKSEAMEASVINANTNLLH